MGAGDIEERSDPARNAPVMGMPLDHVHSTGVHAFWCAELPVAGHRPVCRWSERSNIGRDLANVVPARHERLRRQRFGLLGQPSCTGICSLHKASAPLGRDRSRDSAVDSIRMDDVHDHVAYRSAIPSLVAALCHGQFCGSVGQRGQVGFA